MFNSTEFIILGLILVVFLGSKRLTGLGKGAGEAMRELKKVKKEFDDVTDEITNTDANQKNSKKGKGVAR